MPKLARLAALAAIAALSACAPVTLAVVPAAAYDPAVPTELSADESKLVENLRAAVEEKKLTTQITVDGSAVAAARLMVNRRAEATGVLPSEGRNALLEAGIADLGARWTTNSVGYNDRVPSAEDLGAVLDALGASGGALYVGAADLPDPLHNKRHWALVAVPRALSLNGLPRQAEPGSRLALSGKLLDTVTDLRLELLRPDGVVERHELVPGTDNAFTLSLELPSAAGIYVVGVSARFKGAMRALLAAPVAVGVAPAAWPARAADLEVVDEKALEQAVVKVLGDARGRPIADKKELADSARACVAALAEGKECAAAVPGARLLAWDIAADSIERFVSEMAASPATRASWGSDEAGVAAAKTLGGQYVVVLAFAAPQDGAPAPAAPAPTPAPEPAPTPAPEPAPAPTADPASAPAPAPEPAPAPAPEPAAAPAPAPAGAPAPAQ